MPRRKLTSSSTLGLVGDFIEDQDAEDAPNGSILATGNNGTSTRSNHNITSIFRKRSILPVDNPINDGKNGCLEDTSREKCTKNNGNVTTKARKTSIKPMERSVTRQDIDIALVSRNESSLYSNDDNNNNNYTGDNGRRPKNKLSMKPILSRFTSYPFNSGHSYSYNEKKSRFKKSNSADDFRSLSSAEKRSSSKRHRLSSHSSMFAISQVGLTISFLTSIYLCF